jgi:VIT1/CCC1 family predicted Fe2+/Mn2+ transporter
MARAGDAFPLSVAATLSALALFGFMKGRFTGMNPWVSASRTTVIGGLAAGAAYGIAKAIA